MKEFFDYVRSKLGALSIKQVEGFNVILEATMLMPIKHRSYILATTWHETARTMQPIREYGKGQGRKYGTPDPVTGQIYYGRSYVQLTWKDNYQKACKRLKELGLIANHLDFVKDPDLVMKPIIAAHIIVIGMKEGWFTTKRLSDYNNYEDMRKIVNGTDKAKAIADYAVIFEHALSIMPAEPKPIIPDLEPIEPSKPSLPEPITNASKGIGAIIIGLILAAFAYFGSWLVNGGN